MEINLKKSLVDLDGKEIPNAEMNKVLANALANSKTGDALKFWDWAVKLQAGKKLDLDPSDLSLLKDFVSNEASFFVLTKAQMLGVLNAAK